MMPSLDREETRKVLRGCEWMEDEFS
jgi:hypothetical protein